MQNQNHKFLPYIIHLSFRSTISTWVQIIPQKKGRATLRKEIDAPPIINFLFSVALLPESNNCTIRFSLVSPCPLHPKPLPRRCLQQLQKVHMLTLGPVIQPFRDRQRFLHRFFKRNQLRCPYKKSRLTSMLACLIGENVLHWLAQ